MYRLIVKNIMSTKKQAKRCYNCIYAGKTFNAFFTTHLHCYKPKYEEMYRNGELNSVWETLRVFSSNCDDFVAKLR